MSRIVFEEEYVIVVPTFKEVVPHTHDFYHIFFLGNESACEEIVVVGGGVRHTMAAPDECRLFLMIDPTSDLADCLNEKGFTATYPQRIRLTAPLKITDGDDEDISWSVSGCLKDNGLYSRTAEDEEIEDYRVVRLIREIRDYKHLDDKIEQIASEYKISESRLSHAFKESVGISLKGYLTIARLKYAYKLVVDGKSKTYAALEAGFASPAHLAYICKKQMGISITEVFK
ncbi:MAG: helix-turn-helix transcriptional regulator [Saccharofermentans sp.]|nr:helix-turn-helix transcriptional regulator [Saccharofermentans sp.]